MRPDIIASSDASAGGAGVVHASGMIATAARSFSAAERLASSTTREISTVLFGLLTFASAYARSTVVYRVDNQGVYYIVRYGSTVAELQDISERINELCYINSIKLVVIWVPRLCNIIADLASRLFKHDIDDWCISDRAFIRICNACGLRPSADLFADSRNTRSTIYYSRFFDVGTSGVDALTTVAFKTDGPRGPLYACPPPRVATAFISKLPLPRHTLLVVPAWISAPYYPLIMRDGAPIAGSRLLCRPLPPPTPLSPADPTSFPNRTSFPATTLAPRRTARRTCERQSPQRYPSSCRRLAARRRRRRRRRTRRQRATSARRC